MSYLKVTTRKWENNAGCPALYDVLVDGKIIGDGPHSDLRVLKMGKYWLPIDDKGGKGNIGSYLRRRDAAEHVAEARFPYETTIKLY